MAENHSFFVDGATLRDSTWFTGPIVWWGDSLTCGGVERQLITCAREFQKQGLPVTLLCRSLSPRNGDDYFLKEAQSCCRNVLGFAPHMVDKALFTSARALLASMPIGLSSVFCDNIAAYASWLINMRPRLFHLWNADHVLPVLAAALAGIPKIIIAGQSLSPQHRAPYGFESVDEGLGFTILSNIVTRSGVIMTNNSRAGYEDYSAWLGISPEKIALTPNVFDMSRWSRPEEERIAALRRNLDIPENAPVLGGLFRFVSIKDPELWVSTAARACAVNPDLYAVVGGNGPELSAIKTQIACSPLSSRILFPGIIKDVPAFLSLCSVFLHTAHVEGLPNVLLEAHAAGLPIVTTRCGGAADVVEHGKSGFVVDERDDVVLATHVGFLIKRRDFAQRAGRVGRERVTREFSQERSMGALWRVYADLLPDELPPAVNMVQESTFVSSSVSSRKGTWPLVSVVLPTYNHLSFLPQAIASVLAQDYPHYELIIVDDGSTDGTREYLATLSSPRIKIISGHNTRLPAALNRGFAEAQGEYLTWMSADDICLPRFCSTLAQALQAFPQAVFASASFARINTDGFIVDRLSGEIDRDKILCSNSGVAAFMYRRDAAQRAGLYDSRLEGAEDWDMWLRILDFGKAVNVPCVLYYYRLYDNSMRVTLTDKVLKAATRAAFLALQRIEKCGGIENVYPQIAQCEDREEALFHAYLTLGTRMIAPNSFLKAVAATYLKQAYTLRPDDLRAMGNYAAALAWHGRSKESEELLSRGRARELRSFAVLTEECRKQRRNAGLHIFSCPTLALPGPEESELVRLIDAERLVYTPTYGRADAL